MHVNGARKWLLVLASWLALAAPSQALQIYTEDWPPMTGLRQGKPDGMVGEVVQELQRRLKDSTPVKLVPWPRAYQMVTQVPDVLVFTLQRTPEREKLVTMLGPVSLMANNLYARRGSHVTIKSIDDAKRVSSVATQRDTGYLANLRRLGFTNLDVSTSPQASARKLMAGRVTLWSDSDLTAPYILREIGYPPDAVERKLVLHRMELYLAFSRGTPAPVVHRWLGALRAMQQDGTLGRIQRKWIPDVETPTAVRLIGLPPGAPMPSR